MYSFNTLVTHCLCDFLTIVDNIHMELDNQELDGILYDYRHIPISPIACYVLLLKGLFLPLYKIPLYEFGLLSPHAHSTWVSWEGEQKEVSLCLDRLPQNVS